MTLQGASDPAPGEVDASASETPDGSPPPTLTIADAARATGTNRPLIRRKLRAGEFPHAAKDVQGFWRIAESDLQAAGLVIGGTAPDAEIQRLRNQLSEMQHRAERAEALLEAERRLVEERGRALETARSTIEALKMRVNGVANVPKAARPEPRRTNWQAALRAARAKDIEARAARAAGARAVEQAGAGEDCSTPAPSDPSREHLAFDQVASPPVDLLADDDDRTVTAADEPTGPESPPHETRRRWRRG